MQGRVHIYTGDGKGKTTAATGLAARAAGRGLRVGFLQFLKNGVSGEVASLAKLGVTVLSPQGPGCKFLWDMNDEERAAYRAVQQDTFTRASAMVGELDLLVLDEAMCAVDAGLLEAAQLRGLAQNRPDGLELVFTGRCSEQTLAAISPLADYITEMKCIRHPFEKEIPARKGIEF